MVENFKVGIVANNRIVETNWIVADEKTLPQLLQEFNYVQIIEINKPALLDFQTLSEEKFRNNNGEWQSYYNAVDIPLKDAKEQKDDELSSLFRLDIGWTDEENQFYQKWKASNPNDTSYDAWYVKVTTYWNEAYTEKLKNNTSLKAAKTLEDLRNITYAPTHTNTKESLKTPQKSN